MEKLKIRPYARLLSMLGEQLIKNETVALFELVKNAYDANASVCHVKYDNFSDEMIAQDGARIVIDDDGHGMSKEIITTHFLNPATPIKLQGDMLKKYKSDRITQGEKGIGRFSMLKLGSKITILSKEKSSEIVHKIVFDFDKYDKDFLSEIEKLIERKDALYLDELDVVYEETNITNYDADEFRFASVGSGTAIIIEELKGEWGEKTFKDFTDTMFTFMPIVVNEDGTAKKVEGFEILLYVNGHILDYAKDNITDLTTIIEDKALYKVAGEYSEDKKTIAIRYSEAKTGYKDLVIYLDGEGSQSRATSDFRALEIFRGDKQGRGGIKAFFENGKKTSCGDFKFVFYIFDFDVGQYDKFGLNKSEREIIRTQRIFLYRDGVRVHPYGGRDDDWLQIDRKRAKDKAGKTFGNDQLLGQISISKNGNPNLKDKTSREGIIEDGPAFEHLISIAGGILRYIRAKLYQPYKIAEEKRKSIDAKVEEVIESKTNELRQIFSENPRAVEILDSLEDERKRQADAYKSRLAISEQLAGVGMSVEMASHDIMLTLGKLRELVKGIAFDTGSDLIFDKAKTHKEAVTAEGMVGLIYMNMRDIQQLFVSSKQRARLVDVKEAIVKMEGIYKKAYKNKGIKVNYQEIGSPVKAKLVDAVLFQVFINLFDNALYWLEDIAPSKREVKILLDGNNQTVTFSDNGFGISDKDAPYIFEAFYSGKGEEGRGLGLYIARQLLDKAGYEIEVVTSERAKILQGANIAISFVSKEN